MYQNAKPTVLEMLRSIRSIPDRILCRCGKLSLLA